MIPSELSDKLLDFAARIGSMVDHLPETPLARRVAEGLIGSSTAAGLNYEEAASAERRREFTGQLGDTLKELRKTGYWLRLIVKADMRPEAELGGLIQECDELCGIMEQSISSDRARTWRFGHFGQWQTSDLQFTIYGFPFMTIAMGTRRAGANVGTAGKSKPPEEQ